MRYWKKENVLVSFSGGRTSAFIKMAKSKIGSNNHAARRLINTETGEIFNTIKEVIPLVNLKRTTFQAMLNSQNPNKTKFKYYE